MKPPSTAESERDAWLSMALRHAPDANAAPPVPVRETILRQARAAAAPSVVGASIRPAPRLLAAWAWLARPPVAAGFASVMVATLVGLMWWDRPMNEGLPQPSTITSERRPTTDPTPAESPAKDVSAASSINAEPAATDKRVAETSAAAPTRAEKSAQRSVVVPGNGPDRAALGGAEPAPFGDAPSGLGVAQSKRVEAARMPAAGSTLPDAPKTGPRESPAPGATDATATAPREDSNAPGAESGRLSARTLAKAAPPSSTDAAAAPLRPQDASDRRAPLMELLTSITEQPQRWSWQHGGVALPMTPHLQRWLMELDGATASHWRTAAGSATEHRGNGIVVRLYRDGDLDTTLRIDDEAAWVVPAAGSAYASQAALPRARLAALRRSLDRVAR